ncbi:hypothetical protein Q7P37_000322 [Cladosporium fusiforme]
MFLDKYSSEANYSFAHFNIGNDAVARFGTGSDGNDEEFVFSKFTLEVFCIDSESEPWVSSSGCEDEQVWTCDKLSYGVKSFRMNHTAEEE